MKIHLINFLCYVDSKFDFGKEGLTLISGSSGAGKSSILKGIFFALFGEGNKVQHYGKTSCSVELEFDDPLETGETLKIVRTKRPNHLVINDVYEDAAAQEIINKRFGSTFKTSGYIQQNNLSSFILMSPIDKLGFLEQFAFQDVDLGKIKGRCKSVISETYDELLSTTAQLDMSSKVLEEMQLGEEVIFPLKNSKGGKLSEKNRAIAIKNEHTKYKNNIILLGKLNTDKETNQAKLVDLKMLITVFDAKWESIRGIDKRLEKLEIEESKLSYIGDEEIKILQEKLRQITAKKEFVKLQSIYQDNMEKLQTMALGEMENYEKQRDSLVDNLWKEYTKTDLESTLEELTTCLSDCETIQKLQARLGKIDVDEEMIISEKSRLKTQQEELDKLKKLAKQTKYYNCPQCQSKLHFVEEQLVLSDSYIENMSLEEIEKKIAENIDIISDLEEVINEGEQKLAIKLRLQKDITNLMEQYDEIPEIKSLKEDISYLQEYRVNQTINEKNLRQINHNIENKIFSHSYNNFKKETDNLREKLENLSIPTIEEEVYDEEELRSTIMEQKQINVDMGKIANTKQELMAEKQEYLNDISRHQKEFNEGCEGDIDFEKMREIIENKIEKIIEKITTLESSNQIHKNNIDLIEKWEIWYQEKKKYDEWVEKCKSLKTREKEARKKYTAAMTLKTKILEAESIAIGNIIDTINMHSREYLDCFFPENPISVQLQAFKENKKTAAKPCINILIEYKGMECDINMLSGGELARVVLAYTLALSEIFNTPILLLDECTASLDQELTNVVFDGIRENFKGKLVLIIAHQIIMGTFDKIISL
jgi:DNA repair exonuclease SbcCD ATPase subunit